MPYWTERRIPRRRVLVSGTAAVASVALAGCTPAPAPNPTPQVPTPSSATAPAAAAPTIATTATRPTPKYGGKFSIIELTFMRNLDPHVTSGGGGSCGSHVCYSQLLTYKWGPDVKASYGADVKAPAYVPGPDLAESWTQPDDLTYVFRVRPGVRFHNIAPVNGRELVADDIIYSFDRIRQLKTY